MTGNAGAGKSTVAARIGAALDLPVFGLDAIVWQPGWRKTPDPIKHARIRDLVSDDAWVIDGVSSIALDAADTIIFLDVPRRTCYRRVAQRNVRFLFRSRPGLPEHCPEILIMHRLAKIIWQFPRTVRPAILENALDPGSPQRLIHCH